MARYERLVDTVTVHPLDSISFGVDMQKTSSNGATSPATLVYRLNSTTSVSVTSTVGSPTASTAGTIVYTGNISGWSDGVDYQPELTFTLDGNTITMIWKVKCSDDRGPV